jgi:hypothetical protein
LHLPHVHPVNYAHSSRYLIKGLNSLLPYNAFTSFWTLVYIQIYQGERGYGVVLFNKVCG